VGTAEILRFYYSVFSLVLLSIEKIYQILKTVFDHISNYLEVLQNTALRVVVLRLFSVFDTLQYQTGTANIEAEKLNILHSKSSKT